MAAHKGGGYGLVGRAVTSYARGPQFKSCHWQNLCWTLNAVNSIEKRMIKKKDAVNGTF